MKDKGSEHRLWRKTCQFKHLKALLALITDSTTSVNYSNKCMALIALSAASLPASYSAHNWREPATSTTSVF